YEHLVDLGVLLDESNIPIEGRFVVVPAWYHGLLLKDDRFIKAGTVASDRRLANGEVGEAAGFKILKSNNFPIRRVRHTRSWPAIPSRPPTSNRSSTCTPTNQKSVSGMRSKGCTSTVQRWFGPRLSRCSSLTSHNQ